MARARTNKRFREKSGDSGNTDQALVSQPGLPNSERIYRALKEDILSGELAPETRLVEVTLAERFGVSRTPVREALKRLSTEGLADLDPLRGLIVKGLDVQEVEEVYAIREVLDGLAARLAAERISTEDMARLRTLMEMMSDFVRENRPNALVQANIRFHEIIYQAAGNGRLYRMGLGLADFIRRFSASAFRSHDRDLEVLQEHADLVAALEQRDPETAERIARDHMVKARAFLARASVKAKLSPTP